MCNLGPGDTEAPDEYAPFRRQDAEVNAILTDAVKLEDLLTDDINEVSAIFIPALVDLYCAKSEQDASEQVRYIRGQIEKYVNDKVEVQGG